MKILLVYPQYPPTFWSLKHALNFIDKKAVMPPLGLLTIASLLEGHELKLVDMNAELLSDTDILWADFVFISAMITQKDSAQDVISRCEELGVKIVAGGPLFSNLAHEFPEVDHFVLDEGEVTLPLFLDDLAKGSLQRKYTSKQRPDINLVPIPRWDLINIDDYAKMPLQFSRGCPFDCEFCNIADLNGKVPRVKSPQKFMQELNSLYDAGWRSAIMIVDDNFISNKAKAKELLRAMIDWRKEKKYKATYVTQISLNLADDDELLDLMRQAGFSAVFIGLETPSKVSLEECGKFHNKNRDMLSDIRKIHNYGMEVYGGFIVGFDHDDESIFDTQFKFIQAAGIVVATIGLLNALPGTKLYHRLRAEGRITSESSGDNMDFSTNIVPKMDKEFLISEYKKLLLSLYSVKNYYGRVLNFLADYKHHNSGKFSFYYLILFFKSLYLLGVKDKNRSFFWEVFWVCLLKYPKSLPKVLTQAIYFFHYEKIYEIEARELSKITRKDKMFTRENPTISVPWA